MEAASAVEYLGTLLNRPVAVDTPLRLSSAQRARFGAWLHGHGLHDTPSALNGEFTISALLGDVSMTAAAPTAGTAIDAVAGVDAARAVMLDVGVDIQSIAELTNGINLLDLKADVQMTRLFTARELSYAQVQSEPAQTLAGLFAAKEAVRKCVGGPAWTPQQFQSVEVLPDPHGRPVTAGFAVSISHTAGMAVAIACRGSLPIAASPPTPSPTAATQPAPSASRRIDRILLAAVFVVVGLHLLALLIQHR